MVVSQAVLDELTAQAKASPRLRMNMDLRNGPDDGSQRMLNAIEPNSISVIHGNQKIAPAMEWIGKDWAAR